MKTTFSLGEVHNRKQQRIRSLAQHDAQLTVALTEACEGSGLADGIRSEIIEGGLHRFVIDKEGSVRGIGAFNSMNEYIETFRSKAPESRNISKSAIQHIDDRHMRKQELFEQLKIYSQAGNMKAYRQARSEYAQL